MQKKVTLFVLVAVIGLAAVLIVQTRRAANAKAELAAAQEKSAAAADAVEGQKETIEQLEQQREALAKELREVAAKQQKAELLRKQSESLTRVKANPGVVPEGEPEDSKGGFLAKMLKDPAMKKMMAEQQKVMVNMMYGQLIKDLNFTPEETEKFNALLLDSQMSAASKGIAFMQEDADRDAITKEIAEEKKQFDAQMKEFLGDDRYAQYEDYSKSIPDRMALTQLKSQFGDNPLNEQQSSQLLSFMKEERLRANPTPTDNPFGSPDFKTALSEDGMSKYFENQKLANERVVERSAGVLSPDQIATLKSSLANNLAMQEAGMKMAQAMMGKKSTETGPK